MAGFITILLGVLLAVVGAFFDFGGVANAGAVVIALGLYMLVASRSSFGPGY